MATTFTEYPTGAERRCDQRLAQAQTNLQLRGNRVAAGEVIAITEAEYRPRQMRWVTAAAPARDPASLKKPPVLPPAGALPTPATVRANAQERVNELLLEQRRNAPAPVAFRALPSLGQGVGSVERGG